MTNDLQTISTTPDQNPAAVYLESLAPTGRRSMTARLRSAAELLERVNAEVRWE